MIRRAAALLALCLCSSVALAAQVTHVATADSSDWPVEIDFYAGFQYTSESANIAREEFQPSGGLILATEMNYQRNTMTMPLRAAVGIWHHLELHVTVPIIIDDKQTWSFSSVSNEQNVTIDKTPALCPEGPPSNGLCSNGQAPPPLVTPAANGGNTLPLSSDRGGFQVGNIGIGAAWAALSEEADDTDPTWVIGFDYAAPSASVMNPTRVSYGPGAPGTESAIGDGFHHFQPWTALSKRHGILDPYIEVYADLPRASGNVYNNCVAANGVGTYGNTSQERLNCPQTPGSEWTTWNTQATPVYIGGFWFGSEFVAYENAKEQQKVAIDLRFITEYHSAALTYTEMSDLLQALTYQQDFARLGGQINLNLRPTKYFQLILSGSILHDTDHWLTNEDLGNPAPGSSTVLVGSAGQNPNFDFRYDNPGDRFMLQNSLLWSFTGTLMVSF